MMAKGQWVAIKLATDSALASDTPTLPMKWYRANAASHPGGRNLESVCDNLHQSAQSN